MKGRNLQNRDDWQTPLNIIENLEKEFGFIDFDPCPHNPSFDGLEVEWGYKNFVNPPYSRKLKEAFIRKAFKESKKGKLVIMLLPVSTSTKIFHDVIYPNAEIRFLKGRVHFRGYNTRGEYVENRAGMHDSMIVIFKPIKGDD